MPDIPVLPPPPPSTAAAHVDAGEFGAWMDETLRGQRGGEPPVVPCGDCNTCCTASQFIHVGPEETEARAAIGSDMLFAAPGHDDGTSVMGFDAKGHCPMLKEGACTIYAARPRTCRQYDCRVFAATDVHLEAETLVNIQTRVRRWRFQEEDEAAAAQQRAVKSAARFLREAGDAFAHGPPRAPTMVALVALRTHSLFLDGKALPNDAEKRVRANEIMELNQTFSREP